MSEEYTELLYNNDRVDTKEKYWSGVNQHYVLMKKKHNIIKSYDYYWFVYGKQGYIYFFVLPNSNYGVKKYLLREMKYMTNNEYKITLWNEKKNFTIKFLKREHKQFFDQYYLKCINRDIYLSS